MIDLLIYETIYILLFVTFELHNLFEFIFNPSNTLLLYLSKTKWLENDLINKWISIFFQNYLLIIGFHGMKSLQQARKILELARENDIPIHEDGSLAALLEQIPDGSLVPEQSFAVLAEVLCFLYELDVQWRNKHSFMGKLLAGNH